MRIDVNTFLGKYPYHEIGGWPPAELLGELDRVGVSEAWVSNLNGIFAAEPADANAKLIKSIRGLPRLHPVPSVHPGLGNWETVLKEARTAGAPAVRADPSRVGLEPAGAEMQRLAAACADSGLPLLLAVRLEDTRQRDPSDTAAELQPWAVRALVRSNPRVRLIVTHAERDFVEQVHFGSTPDEASRILWDICWIWGPPEDHLETLLRTVGVERFVFGTGIPLRMGESSVAKLDLLDLTTDARKAIEGGNLLGWL